MAMPVGRSGGTIRDWAVALAVILGSGWCGDAAQAESGPQILCIRTSTGPDHTRVVLDLDRAVSYDVRRVSSPERIAVNVAGAVFRGVGNRKIGDGHVKRIRCNGDGGRAQVVIDLAGVREFRTFALSADGNRPDRIVVDILRGPGGDRAPDKNPPELPLAGMTERETAFGEIFTVVVDPGHGGADPGALREGLREKDLCLSLALEVARLLGDRPGYRAVLTRERDETLALGRRVDIAREQRGDVFVSIHCNTHPRSAVSGMEVYFLSLQGATDREARELADKENAAGLVGLPPGQEHTDLVVDILMDLQMTRVLYDSGRLAGCLLGAADRSGIIEGRRVKQAGFQVLKSLAMPSALVEVAYLSNAKDRRLLTDRAQRRQLASAIVDGIVGWRSGSMEPVRGAPPVLAGGASTEAWNFDYRVKRGDSLWGLARNHGTTVGAIAQHNGLAARELRVGQRLRLPGTGARP